MSEASRRTPTNANGRPSRSRRSIAAIAFGSRTSRPTPAAFAETYERLAADGATEIVSIHISGDMSGTFESAP